MRHNESDQGFIPCFGSGEEIGTDLIKYLGEYMKNIAPDASLRYGDYPIEKGLIDVTVVLSGFPTLEKIESYFEIGDKADATPS